MSGAALDPSAVKKARAEEIDYVRKMHLYTKVPISECLAKTGKQPIAVRWIDVNKHDDVCLMFCRFGLLLNEVHERDIENKLKSDHILEYPLVLMHHQMSL